MRWLIAAPFSTSKTDPWLGRFVPGKNHTFESVPSDYSHDRSRATTPAVGWLDYLRHARQTLRAVPRADKSTGVITCFPQIPTMLGLLGRLTFRDVPVVAWSFNLGALPTGARRYFSRLALRKIALFVVHSRAEIEACSRWLGLDKDRFAFVPLQCPRRTTTIPENVEQPFLLSMGSANRDYALLFDVVRELGVRTIVVAGRHALEHLDIPPNVELKSGLTAEQCHALLQACRVTVVPVANAQTASGQVTLLDALAFGRPTIVTLCPGSVDYIVDGVTALAIQPGDRAQMKNAIARLWDDAKLRARLSESARADALEHFTDEAVALTLGAICDSIERQRAPLAQ